MTDIICINDTFEPYKLAFFKQFGVTTPKKDVLYSIRDIITASIHTSSKAFLLNEIVNKPVPIKHPLLGLVMMEISWNVTRFTDLQGNVFTKEMLAEIIKLLQPEINIVQR